MTGKISQLQWSLLEDTTGMSKDLVWRLTVRDQSDQALDTFLKMLKAEGALMVIVRDTKDMWTLFMHRLGEKK